MISLESPKKQQCLDQRRQLIMSSTARMAALYSAWFDVIMGVVATSFKISSVLKKITAPERPYIFIFNCLIFFFDGRAGGVEGGVGRCLEDWRWRLKGRGVWVVGLLFPRPFFGFLFCFITFGVVELAM